ncbi:hypothetical protein Bbelb_120350 [Branchiostoma belcheri]|nr:hypothetical protein Bbelb_120350 [Branchiostoma belcheri]
MSNKARRMLVLLLIILKEAGPTAACSSSCSSYCNCRNRGLTSVPQDLPTDITYLDLDHNTITTLNQSDFTRYRSLTRLAFQRNRISMIHNKTFHNLTSLTRLSLNVNHLTTLPADIFEGLENLQELWLSTNKLTSLPAGIFEGLGNLQALDLFNNQLTSLSADIFEGLGNLQYLDLAINQLTSLPAGIFEGRGNLQTLWLYTNQLSSLSADIFEGLGNLERLGLDRNNIHSIEAGTFNHTTKLHRLDLQYNSNISTITADTFGNLLQLQTLRLSHNKVNTFPVETLSNLNMLSELTLDNNQLETLPVMAYDILASISTVNIDNNPWQCDCRMAPFRQRMSGSYPFENQTRCAGPANLTGQLLQDVNPEDLRDVTLNPEDLICEETTPVYSTSSTKHMVDSTDPPFPSTVTLTLTESNTGPTDGGIVLSVPLIATLGAIFVLLLICIISFAVGCMYKRQKDPTPQQGFSNTNPTGTSSGHNQIMLQAVGTSAGIISQSETSHPDRASLHIYDDPDTSENQTGPQAAAQIESADAATRTIGGRDTRTDEEEYDDVLSPSQTSQPGSGQIQHLGSFNDGYEEPSRLLYTALMPPGLRHN